jgi:tetratricopeptide (TPR) repeat protein
MADVLHLPREASLQENILATLKQAKTLICLDGFEVPLHLSKDNKSLVEEFLRQLDGISSLSMILTLCGKHPRSLTRPRSQPLDLGPLSESSMQKIFEILSGCPCDADAKFLLEEVGGLPLAAMILAHKVKDGTRTSNLRKRWPQEKTSLFEIGHSGSRNSSLDATIGLSIQYVQEAPFARHLLSILAVLPNGLPEESQLIDAFKEKFPEGHNISKCMELLQVGNVAFRDDKAEPPRICLNPAIRNYCLKHLPLDDPTQLDYIYVELFAQMRVSSLRAWACMDLVPSHNINMIQPEIRNFEYCVGNILQSTVPLGSKVFSAVANYAVCCRSLRCVYSTRHGVDIISRTLGRVDKDDLLTKWCLYWSLSLLHDTEGQGSDAGRASAEAVSLFQECFSVPELSIVYREKGNVILNDGHSTLLPETENYESTAELHQALYTCEAALPKNAGSERAAISMKEGRDYMVDPGPKSLDRAEELLSRALTEYQKLGNVLGEANARLLLGIVYMRKEELDKAQDVLNKASSRYTELDNRLGLFNCTSRFGELYMRRKDFGKALSFLEKADEIGSIGMGDGIDHTDDFANNSANLGRIYIANDVKRFAEAAVCFSEAAVLYEDAKNSYWASYSYISFGYCLLHQAQHDQRVDKALSTFEFVKEKFYCGDGADKTLIMLKHFISGCESLLESRASDAKAEFELAVKIYTELYYNDSTGC